MVLVGAETDKVIAYQLYSRQCSLCHRMGYGKHAGQCNSNYDGTAKSMEANGMVACLKKVAEQGFKVSEVVLDNDGNTISKLQVTSVTIPIISFLGFCLSYLCHFIIPDQIMLCYDAQIKPRSIFIFDYTGSWVH